MADAETLTRHIQQLATAVHDLAIQQEGYINVQPQEEEEEEESNNENNPFAKKQEDLRWEEGFQFELPEFNGFESAEEFLDWIFTVEGFLEFKRVPLERCVPMIVLRFRGRAAAWWSKLKLSRASLSKPRILSWDILKKKMCKTFLPFNQGKHSVEQYSTQVFTLLTRANVEYSDHQIVTRFVGGLRKNIRDHLNLLNPLTVAEAHEHALALEAQNKKDELAQNQDDEFWFKAWCMITLAAGWFAGGLLLHSLERNMKKKKKPIMKICGGSKGSRFERSMEAHNRMFKLMEASRNRLEARIEAYRNHLQAQMDSS